jgi:hypothetical protein
VARRLGRKTHLALCPLARRVAHRDYNLTKSRPEEWLLIEWPKGDAEPKKYWFSTLQQNITFRNLVDLTKLRWRIERDYQELKQEVGLGHFEGRGWRGFHHHATLCIATYGFLISERETIPPSAPRSTAMFQAHSKLDCDHAPTVRPHLVKNLPRCPCCAASIRNRAKTL